ncbi:hypothetical protein [Hymenobacter koreensis]|uniref:Uncharacterized protein n=1 Tax=Hymenobacter koreensis TaxID=1084523 RepID=A0ABP8JK62_9BACT
MRTPAEYAAHCIAAFAALPEHGAILSRDEEVYALSKFVAETVLQDAERYKTNLAMALIRSEQQLHPTHTTITGTPV